MQSCQDRLAELQSELLRVPSAVMLSKKSWENRKDTLVHRATKAVRKVAAHVLGFDLLGSTATNEDARKAYEGSLLVSHEFKGCDTPDKDTPPEQVAAFFGFWLCEERDKEFVSWVKDYKHKEELAKLAARSPRVRLGLAQDISKELPLGVNIGPPKRITGYLVPTELEQRLTPDIKHLEWIRLKATETFTQRKNTDPARDPEGIVPKFNCSYTDGLGVSFPELEFSPQPTLVLDRPDNLPTKQLNTPTRGQFAQALIDIVQELPPIPKGAMEPWFVLKTLAEKKIENAKTQAKRERAVRVRERITKLYNTWPLDADSLPIPQIQINTPDVAWVETLEILAESCIPTVYFPQTVFENVLPLAQDELKDTQQVTPTEEEKRHRDKNMPWELESLHSTWWLLNNALQVCGFSSVSFDEYKSGKKVHLESTGDKTDPLRCNAAWSRWQYALWRNFLESPDDLVPVTLGVLDWLTQGNSKLVDTLRWSAEIAGWAGKTVHSDPDGMWCAYKKIQLRLGKLRTLPEIPQKTQEKG